MFDDGQIRRQQIADLEHLIDYLTDHPEAYLAFLETQEAAYFEALALAAERRGARGEGEARFACDARSSLT